MEIVRRLNNNYLPLTKLSIRYTLLRKLLLRTHIDRQIVNGWREGSDSEGEVDYPDEESGDDDSEDEMGGRGSRRMH